MFSPDRLYCERFVAMVKYMYSRLLTFTRFRTDAMVLEGEECNRVTYVAEKHHAEENGSRLGRRARRTLLQLEFLMQICATKRAAQDGEKAKRFDRKIVERGN